MMQHRKITDRTIALNAAGDAAADVIQRLERVKPYLNELTPEEAQLWFLARQACDRLYAAVNKDQR